MNHDADKSIARLTRLAEHLASTNVDAKLRCELAIRGSTTTRCESTTVAIRWEDNFADSVCELHAQSALERGAIVIYPRRQDGTS